MRARAAARGMDCSGGLSNDRRSIHGARIRSAGPRPATRSRVARIAGYGIVLLAVLDCEFSPLTLLYALTAKYHVPEVRAVSVYVERLGFVSSTVWLRAAAD